MRATYGWSEAHRRRLELARWPVGLALMVFAIAVLLDHAPRRRQPALSWLALGAGLSVLLAMAATASAGGLRPPQRLVRRDLRPARRRVRAAALVAAQLDRAVRGRGGLRPAGVPAGRAAGTRSTTTRAARRARWCRIEPGEHPRASSCCTGTTCTAATTPWPGSAPGPGEIREAADHPVLLLDGGDVEETVGAAVRADLRGGRLADARRGRASTPRSPATAACCATARTVLPRYAAGSGPRRWSATSSATARRRPARRPRGCSSRRPPGRASSGSPTSTRSTTTSASPSAAACTAVRREAEALRRDGADVVVLLSHAGLNHDRGVSWALRGLVDVIVGGHTHHLLDGGDRDAGRCRSRRPAGFAEHLGRVLLEVDDGRRPRRGPVGRGRAPRTPRPTRPCWPSWPPASGTSATGSPSPSRQLSAPVPHDGPDNPVGRLLLEALLAPGAGRPRGADRRALRGGPARGHGHPRPRLGRDLLAGEPQHRDAHRRRGPADAGARTVRGVRDPPLAHVPAAARSARCR